MKYVIGRPINGISLNGLEYLYDSNNKKLIFDNREDCVKYIKQSIRVDNKPPTENFINELIWEDE